MTTMEATYDRKTWVSVHTKWNYKDYIQVQKSTASSLANILTEKKAIFSVENKFNVMHYEGKWPPYEQRESWVPVNKKSRFMSDLLRKKVTNKLRKLITTKQFKSIAEIKKFVLDHIKSTVTQEDFWEMALVKVNIKERKMRWWKIEITFQWFDPHKDDPMYEDYNNTLKHINDPRFAIKIIEKS